MNINNSTSDQGRAPRRASVRGWFSRWSVGLVLIACATSALHAAEPVLKSFFPCGGRAGQSVEVRILGDHLKAVTGVYFSRPGIVAERIADDRFRFTLDESLPPGPIEVRVATAGGLSAPRRFLVDRLTGVVEQEPNDSLENASSMPLPGALDARLDQAADVDWFRFQGSADQAVTLVCRSATLDGSVEPSIRLLDPSGRLLATSPPHLWEPYLHARLPVAGEYLVRVCDRAYRADDFSFYRLQLFEGPVAVAAYPHTVNPAAPSSNVPSSNAPSFNATGEIELAGFALDGPRLPGADHEFTTQTTRLVLPPGDGPGETAVRAGNPLTTAVLRDEFHWAAEGIEGGLRIGRTSHPVTLESQTPHASSEAAQPVKLPCLVAGRFLTAGEVDWYRFSATKGQSIKIDLWGERLGQRMDPDAAVHDTAGKLLFAVPDKPAVKGVPASLSLASLDPAGTWKAPADGEYLLAVRDLYGGSVFGADRAYTLRLAEPRPSFQVIAMASTDKPLGLSVAKGGKTTVNLLAVREGGFDGPITVRAEGLPPGVQAEPATLEGKEVSKIFTLSTAKDAPAGTHAWRLVAEATIGSDTVTRPVVNAAVVRAGAVRRTEGLPLLVREP